MTDTSKTVQCFLGSALIYMESVNIEAHIRKCKAFIRLSQGVSTYQITSRVGEPLFMHVRL